MAACALLPPAARGQVDPSGEWRTWHTEHFRVHAKAALADHAREAGREAERAYAALTTELKPPRNRIDLVVGDDVDFSNGFATVLPSPRITVNLAAPATKNSTSIYDSWLRLVITHELAHIFHLDRAGGIWGVLQKLFGRAPGLFPNTYQPGWVSEGIATYYESRFTGAGRLRGGYHDQVLRSASQSGTWPGPGDAVRANMSWPAGVRPYAWGSHFFDSQRRLHGDSVVPRFVERTSRQLNVFRVSGPMEGAGGESVGDGWQRIRPPTTPVPRPDQVLVRGLRANPKPRVSPERKRIAFVRDDGMSDPHIIVRDMRTGSHIASHRVTSPGDLAWVGDTLYVTQMEYLSPVEARSDLYRWVPGEHWARVSKGGRHTSVFSAGDSRVGLVSLRGGAKSVGTLTYPATAVAGLPVPSHATDWGRIAVSPDGRWVAAARHASGQWDIVLWPAEHPDRYRLVTDDASFDADPIWSIDGKQLLFSSERFGLPQILAYDIEAGRTARLTNEPAGARNPGDLGDGSFIFVTLFGDGYAVARQLRSRDALPEGATISEHRSAVEVPDVEQRETAYSPWPSLRPHFWIPLAHDEASAGLFLGALTLGVDAIGRTQYSAVLTAAPEQRRVEGVFYLAHKRWRSWTAEIAAGQTWDHDPFLVDGAIVPISFRERAAELGLKYQWLRWRSGVGLRLKGFLENDVLINEGVDPLPFTPANPVFAGGALSVSAASMSRPALSISPENGVSVQGVLMHRWQVDGSQYQSHEVRGTVSGYLALPLPGFSHWVLAASVAGGKTGGTAPTTYSIGGESGEIVELIPGTALGSGRRTFQMRGYRAVGGFTRAVVGVAEMRIPVVLAARGVPGLPLFVDRVSFNVFGEVGNAWREGERANLAGLKDVGGEAAVDLGVGAGLKLRVRVGGAVALNDGLGSARGDVRYYLAFGRGF